MGTHSNRKKKTTKKVARRKPTTSEWAKVGYSTIHGRGMYARKDIPKDTRIIEYLGRKVTKRQADKIDEERLARKAAGGDGCVYIFELNKRHDIDGSMAWNTARLMNHSCAGNCEPQRTPGHIWIVAKRDIKKGEELVYDYGFDLENWRDHPCRCGTPDCVGFIVKKNQRWRVRRLIAAGALERRSE